MAEGQKEEKMKMTAYQAVKLSEEMWTWLAETGKRKKDWPGFSKMERMAIHCYCCEYSLHHPKWVCPLGCSQADSTASCAQGYFDKWISARNSVDRKVAATYIRDALGAWLREHGKNTK